jgi:hypothetical protein
VNTPGQRFTIARSITLHHRHLPATSPPPLNDAPRQGCLPPTPSPVVIATVFQSRLAHGS